MSSLAIDLTQRPSINGRWPGNRQKAAGALCYDPATWLHSNIVIVPQTYFRLSMIRMCSARIAATLLAVLLALLGAQWAGLQHRVAHALIAEAGDSAGGDEAAATPDDGDGPDLAHSCMLFDAAALGATLHSTFLLPVCLRAVMSRLRPAQTVSWQAHPFRHFSPRAPPLP